MSVRVYTSGVFDLFHAGHLRAIQAAAAQGGERGAHLIVGVSRDESCAQYKRAPVIPFEQRMEIIAGLKCVDEVIEAPNYPTEEFYRALKIDLAVQGRDDPEFAFYEIPKRLGIMRFVGYHDITSTTEIIARVQARIADDEYKVNPAVAFAAPRKPGISAYMRLKNEAEFARLAIESHLPFYDEIVCVYNDCNDATPDILRELAAAHPKIKVFHYAPKVHPLRSKEHAESPSDSVHSMANYYNYALSKTTYSMAVKLDGDHLAIPRHLAPAIAKIRADMAAGKRKLYYFSGINLIRCQGEIMAGGYERYPFSGEGDICYHPVEPGLCYWQGRTTEKFARTNPRELLQEHLGLLYFHLNHLKAGRSVEFGAPDAFGIHRAPGDAGPRFGDFIAMPFAEFRSARNEARIIRMLRLRDRMRLPLHRPALLRRVFRAVTRRNPRFRVARLLRLREDLRQIDFQKDALDRLPRPAAGPH